MEWRRIQKVLAQAGFDLLEDPQYARAAQVKRTVVELLCRPEAIPHRDFMPLLVQAVVLSGRQLHRLFAQLPDGESLPGYITRQRLTYAQELLVTGDLTKAEQQQLLHLLHKPDTFHHPIFSGPRPQSLKELPRPY
ncbi:helix-turn-helix transcriptional regulator [Hymenobacter lapidiphilus]|uniref:Uncharacterized protein n=1 Tax=Hymenobacter lapidiphilus TaxID=2608003 RepID=A0A7Y7PPX3_9BACT|nr:hypothetical protein [Hymenobacter lapidiphilus]NVO31838.1 hypothetical protein [Hymenobacter lapidiphilus]